MADPLATSQSASVQVSTFATGTLTPGDNAEHFLSSPNVAGRFRLKVDTVNLAAGDVIELRVYQMTVTGGTTRVKLIGRYAGAQPTDDLIKESDDIWNDLTDTNAVRFSLTQTFGTTSHTFPWAVVKVG